MGRSNENPKKIVVTGGQIYSKDEKTNSLVMPPEKSTKYEIVNKDKEYDEKDFVVIKLGAYKCEKDENGKRVNIKYLGNNKKQEVERD